MDEEMVNGNEESEMYNKNGRMRHELVPFTEFQHTRQLNFAKYSTPFKESSLTEDKPVNESQPPEPFQLDLNELLRKKDLFYYELMKQVVN